MQVPFGKKESERKRTDGGRDSHNRPDLNKELLSAIALLMATAASADRPDIVIILADDMAYGDCGVYKPGVKN